MKKIIVAALCAGALLIGSGCVNNIVPKTALSGNFVTGEFKVLAPKDVEIRGLNITRLTNGGVQIHIDQYIGKNNPQVISAAMQGQIELVKAGGQAGGLAVGQVLGIMSGRPPASAPQPQPQASGILQETLPPGVIPQNIPATEPTEK